MARGIKGLKAAKLLKARQDDRTKMSSRESKVQSRIDGGGFPMPGSMNGRKSG